MRFIVDASAFLEVADAASPLGEMARQMRALLGSHEVVAPALVVWEIGNRLARSRAFGAIEGAQGVTLHMRFLLQDVALDTPDEAAIQRTVEICRKHSLTFYDASYLELAMRDPGSALISEDGKLLTAGEEELGKSRTLDVSAARTFLAST